MKQEKKLTQADIKKLRKTVFTEDELHRKNSKKENQHCPYRITRKWDPKKQKYVKIKIYKKRTKMSKKDLKIFFKASLTPTTQKVKVEKKQQHVVNKQQKPNVTKSVSIKIHGKKLVWDQSTLRYKRTA